MPSEGDSAPEFYTLAETAERLRVTSGTVRNLIRRRELAVVKVGRQIRIPVKALDAFIQAHTTYLEESSPC